MIEGENLGELAVDASSDAVTCAARADSTITIEMDDFILRQLAGDIGHGETASLKAVTVRGAVRISGSMNSNRLYGRLVDLVPRIKERIAGITSIDITGVRHPGL